MWTGHSLPGVIVVSLSVWDGRTRWDTAGHGSPSGERRATTVWVANRNACAGGKIMQASCMSNVEARDSGQHQQPSTSKMISNKTCVAPRDLLLTNYLSSGRRMCRRRASRAARGQQGRSGHEADTWHLAAWGLRGVVASPATHFASSRVEARQVTATKKAEVGFRRGGGEERDCQRKHGKLPQHALKRPTATDGPRTGDRMNARKPAIDFVSGNPRMA